MTPETKSGGTSKNDQPDSIWLIVLKIAEALIRLLAALIELLGKIW
jgi:hypothetical protein